jgi:hypothetical protein
MMHQNTFRLIFIATGALASFSIIVFWSFNQLSELFGGPQAQFKHAIAAIGVLLAIKWTAARFRSGHEQSGIGHPRLLNSRDSAGDH